MCRLLAISSEEEFSIAEHLWTFAYISRTSSEYQGHGWGCSVWRDGQWDIYRSVKPIWEDDLDRFGKTTRLLVHARSAFRDEGIVVENNMPFDRSPYVFIFNGELHGVRVKSEGRIGAEKIFNYILRMNNVSLKTGSDMSPGDKASAEKAAASDAPLLPPLKRAMGIIEKQSRFIRAMNVIVADEDHFYLNTMFNDAPNYFSMHRKREADKLILCSMPYPNELGWERIRNRTVEVYPC